MAVAILGMSLGALYQAVGGATRIVGVDEKTAYGVELARSLVAKHALVPATGFSDSGETEGGFLWDVKVDPIVLPQESPLAEGMLQHIAVVVRWPDGGKERQFSLESVVAGREEDE